MRILPPEIHNCRNWLLANRRFDDANIVSRIMVNAENERKIPETDGMFLKSILEEYCNRHNLIPAYRKQRTQNADDFLERIMKMKQEMERKRRR